MTANYVRIRVANPSLFSRFRVKLLGKGIKAVVGFKKGGGSEIQSFLFPKSQYNLAQAKAWIKEHKYHVSETEAFDVFDINLNPKVDETGKIIDYELLLDEEVIPEYHEVKIPTDEELIAMATKKDKKDEYAWLVE